MLLLVINSLIRGLGTFICLFLIVYYSLIVERLDKIEKMHVEIVNKEKSIVKGYIQSSTYKNLVAFKKDFFNKINMLKSIFSVVFIFKSENVFQKYVTRLSNVEKEMRVYLSK
ncbi:hypothetical protein D3C81_08430 [compost metagenome]